MTISLTKPLRLIRTSTILCGFVVLLLAGIVLAQQNPHGSITIDCQTCHSTAGWSELRSDMQFDHNQQTVFPLIGQHENVSCAECHSSLVFSDAESQCLDCHTDVHRGQFSNDCEQCHTPRQWIDRSQFAQMHDGTRFPLVGLHRDLDCQACHTDGQYVNLAIECAGCHLDQYEAVTEPDHRLAGFSLDCAKCHSVSEAEWKNPVFEHTPAFPLTGGHAINDCQTCHAQGYSTTSTVCVDCHAEDYQQTTNPRHETPAFPTTCEECHSITAWEPAAFAQHDQTAFPLTGAHIAADCQQCHVGGQYTGTQTACLACHEQNYNEADDPEHISELFPTTCEQCHSTAAWDNATFENHDQTPFPLTGAHITTDCIQCHANGFSGTPTDCFACHEADYNEAEGHQVQGYPADCAQCHNTSNWDDADFSHDNTDFPLTGAHIQTNCLDCHVGGVFEGTPTDCWSCHEEDYVSTDDPNHVQEQYPQTCEICHNTSNWDETTFDHNLTAFPLTGAHIETNCLDCHANGYTGIPMDCWSCHEEDYNDADDHLSEQYPQNCEMCHNTSNWEDSDFNHDDTVFPLTGAHLGQNCSECHVGGVFTGTPTDCYACHQEDYEDADDPDHTDSGFPFNCTICHNTSDWDDADFSHNNNNFPLTGAHIETNCLECHANGYEGTPTDCWSCHDSDYNDADDHVEDNYPHDCTICHNTSDWEDADFSHNNTNFPLTGAHIETNCLECHANGYEGTPTDCWSCHQEDYNDADDHVEDNYPHDCTICHNTSDWEDEDFNHNNTNFPLTGAHVGESCGECHIGGVFEGTPTDCWSCHQEDYLDADDHVEENYPHDCSMCHSTNDWDDDDRFTHSQTNFPLRGAHADANCLECHIGGNYSALPMVCSACHQDDFDNSLNPDHEAAGFSTSCSDCHNDESWSDGIFDHSTTEFQLTGAHLEPSCSECHTATPYSATSTLCTDCHQADTNAADDPDHSGTAFQQNCAECHTATEWAAANFDHTLASFQLSGAHVSLDCAQCHVSGFTGTSDNCFACHEAVYTQTTNPDHAGSSFSHDCEMCHSTVNWDNAEFDHALSDFPLTSAHMAVSCLECHVNGQYTGTPQECLACHEEDYESTSEPDHNDAGFSTSCTECHSTDRWTDAIFDHTLTGFPLTGTHIEPTCSQCHNSGAYETTSSECITCHLEDFENSVNPDHSATGYPTNCEQCHTTAEWSNAAFNHDLNDFPLTGAHLGTNCSSCHVNNIFDGLATNCASCHQEDFDGTANPEHSLAGFGSNCEVCHTTSNWQTEYDHNQTGFPLTGSHVGPSCAECHISGNYAETSSECLGCHEADYSSATEPLHAGQFPTACGDCHNTVSWDAADFSHNQTAFPLTGSHIEASCVQCHVGGVFAGTGSACFACHESEYNSTSDPSHVQAGFSTDCNACHTTVAWGDAEFDHNLTSFPLTGAHIQVNCATCHTTGEYSGTPTGCFACHADDYSGVGDPDHTGSNFSQSCEQCHSTASWSGAFFDHNLADFQLTGAHLNANCSQCHTDGYTGTSSYCYSCHSDDYHSTSNPDHELPAFSHTCNDCHATTQWPGASFNHDLSGFPLTGAHITVDCFTCHVGGQYSGIGDQCIGCHNADYTESAEPNHTDAGFSTGCEQCHSTSNWTSTEFDHATTGFPLTGAHIEPTCSQCHTGGPYNETSSACFICHESDYNEADNPNHAAGGYPTTCTQCHSTSSWEDADFNHELTDFPLTGAHQTASCVQCHVGGIYSGLSIACIDCHETDYNSTNNPNHSDAGFSTACNDCHTTSSWQTEYDHEQTGFPLTGAHLSLNCFQCHTGGPFSGLGSACIDCHEADYLAANDPDHDGYPTSCEQCHTTVSWDGAVFDHGSTGFPLTGAHMSASCLQCHVGGVYDGLPSNCADCHQTTYDNTTEPNHTAAGFGLLCNDCHTTANWDANFDHTSTGFPLTGAHLSQSCVVCHGGGIYDGLASLCYDCHQADYNGAADPDHTGYPTTCEQCHSTNNWEGASFDHNATDFPLIGSHLALACAQCHSSGYAGTPVDCYSCHSDDYNNTDDPNHATAGFPTTCEACHNTNDWDDADFNHNATGFPLTGAHISASCAECHIGGQYSGTPTDCFFCHESDYDDAGSPDHSAGYPQTCDDCHSTSNWSSAFNHDSQYFPIYSGEHRREWDFCIECHIVPGNFAIFSCIECHDNDHDNVPGYTYTPTSCYECHPTGEGEGGDDFRRSPSPTNKRRTKGGGK